MTPEKLIDMRSERKCKKASETENRTKIQRSKFR